MAKKPTAPIGPPIPYRYGKVPGFGQRPRIEPGACPTCGAFPPCDPPPRTSR